MAYATWNPADIGSGLSLSDGNLKVTATTTAHKSVRASERIIGKRYWEYIIDAAPSVYLYLGVGKNTASLGTYTGAESVSWSFSKNGSRYNNGIAVVLNVLPNVGAVINMAVDVPNLWIGVNGAWLNGGNPETGEIPLYNNLSNDLYPMVGIYPAGGAIVANFGASVFSYSVPSGFLSGVFLETYKISGVVKVGTSLYPSAKLILIDRVSLEKIADTTADEITAEYEFTGLDYGDVKRYGIYAIGDDGIYKDVAVGEITAEAE